jgi:hypothetical protein
MQKEIFIKKVCDFFDTEVAPTITNPWSRFALGGLLLTGIHKVALPDEIDVTDVQHFFEGAFRASPEITISPIEVIPQGLKGVADHVLNLQMTFRQADADKFIAMLSE